MFPTEPKGRGDEFVSELRGLPNVILTPHIGGSTEEAQADIGSFVANKLAQFVQRGHHHAVASTCPPVALPQPAGTHRIVHVHRNTPGRAGRRSTASWPSTTSTSRASCWAPAASSATCSPTSAPTTPTRCVAQLRAMSQTDPAAGAVVTRPRWRSAARRSSARRTCWSTPDLQASYETDWTRPVPGDRPLRGAPGGHRRGGRGRAGLRRRPACRSTVQGGNTGLVGGGVPAGGEVLLSLTRLTELEPVDPRRRRRSPSAPASRLEKLQQHARAAGLDFGVDLAARSPATVGGLVATNAGGIRVVRYGSMRDQLTGLEAVLADGTVLSPARRPAKDNTGYDLTQLLVRQRGHPGGHHPGPAAPGAAAAGARRWRWSAVDGTDARAGPAGRGPRPAADAVRGRALPTPTGLDLVRAHGRPARAVRRRATRRTWCSSAPAAPTRPTTCWSCSASATAVGDATVASDAAGRARLWAYRETHTEAISAAGVPVKLDVCVPLRELAGAGRRAAGHGRGGRAGRPDDHLRPPQRGQPARQRAGRGRARRGRSPTRCCGWSRRGAAASAPSTASAGPRPRWLSLSRSPEEIATMRRIKSALDPAGTAQPRRPVGQLTRDPKLR